MAIRNNYVNSDLRSRKDVNMCASVCVCVCVCVCELYIYIYIYIIIYILGVRYVFTSGLVSS